MTIIERPSPNCSPRRGRTGRIDAIIIHDTEGLGPGALAWLTDPASGVSCHYLIDTDGTVYRLVPDAMRAWHAGASNLYGDGDVNDFSLGIELVDVDVATPYPIAQLHAAEILVASLVTRYRIPLNRIVGHEHVAPGRKTDPGRDFDWYSFLLGVAEIAGVAM